MLQILKLFFKMKIREQRNKKAVCHIKTYLDKNKDLFYSSTTIPRLDEARGKVVLLNGKGKGCEDGELGLCKKNGAWSKQSEENDWEPDCDPKNKGGTVSAYFTPANFFSDRHCVLSEYC